MGRTDTWGRALPGRWRPGPEEGDLWCVLERREPFVVGQQEAEQSSWSEGRWEGRCNGQFIHCLVGKEALEGVPV